MNPTFRSDMGVELVDFMGSDQRIADAARVSTGTDGKDVSQGFIDFLMKNRHGSPFESSIFQFKIECPIFVAREFMRHRIASYNEESGRYKQLEPVFYVPGKFRDLVQVGKPGEYQFEKGTVGQAEMVLTDMIENSLASYERYDFLLHSGIAREVSRMVLPLNIYTSFYVTMNARSLMNFLSLREKTSFTTVPTFPQHEIQMVAEKMCDVFADKLPMSYVAFIENGRIAP